MASSFEAVGVDLELGFGHEREPEIGCASGRGGEAEVEHADGFVTGHVPARARTEAGPELESGATVGFAKTEMESAGPGTAAGSEVANIDSVLADPYTPLGLVKIDLAQLIGMYAVRRGLGLWAAGMAEFEPGVAEGQVATEGFGFGIEARRGLGTEMFVRIDVARRDGSVREEQ